MAPNLFTIVLSIVLTLGTLWVAERMQWFIPTPPPPATVNMAEILRVYNEELTRQVLDGQVQGAKVTEFLTSIDTAVRSVVQELEVTRHQPIFLKDAVLTPSHDLTEEALLLMARRHPQLRTKLQTASPSPATMPAPSSAPTPTPGLPTEKP